MLLAMLIGVLGVVNPFKDRFTTQLERFWVAAMPQQVSKGVRISSSHDCVDEAQQEQQEASRLRSLAKITPQQAKQVAEAALGGKVTDVELENENGNLVYEVLIGQTEAIIDAGNGHLLYTENEAKNERLHPPSSIQVPKDDKSDE